MFNPKKKFFKEKIKQVTMTIWELEFKVEKSRQVREGIRQDRDRAIESILQIETLLKNPDNAPEQKEQGEKSLALFKDQASRFEAQIKMIDDQINGIPAEGENPGQQGILETIHGLVELKGMYKEYVKSL